LNKELLNLYLSYIFGAKMQTVYVNVDCANIYKEGKYQSAVVSQAVLWEELKITRQESQFSQVICEDGYEGWISNQQISVSSITYETEMISSNHVYILNEPVENAAVIREAGAGCNVPVMKKDKDWFQIVLPDGENGWVTKTAFAAIKGDPRENLLKLAPRFTGIPYFWGGKTAKALDCSGYSQLLHKLVGIKIRRDSPMQCEDAGFISKNFLDGNPGDLLFFAENGDRITHVAIKLNEKEVIHARGRVRINSLDRNSANFDALLINTFVAVKTFF
jgi:gamma-D-glutamyl-L-lysine dipeptidyl-peptidase